jgi:hypothetical protein
VGAVTRFADRGLVVLQLSSVELLPGSPCHHHLTRSAKQPRFVTAVSGRRRSLAELRCGGSESEPPAGRPSSAGASQAIKIRERTTRGTPPEGEARRMVVVLTSWPLRVKRGL